MNRYRDVSFLLEAPQPIHEPLRGRGTLGRRVLFAIPRSVTARKAARESTIYRSRYGSHSASTGW
jgi:hypothetical protein